MGGGGKDNPEYNYGILEVLFIQLLRVINIENLIKLYKKANKYSGQNNNFVYKYSIFLNNY
ncbi:uncharacterized protein Bfra_011797 [Botrytis fragariae]|uniref:Uncharacterized protein n=1 Tax=Botrytis fragariae TaxID=1964551 RepID=A0A8H6AKW3_9HELO|nr:uncharacterized protein Bfra_011797 [Botrytis fragariae]KAF5869254.1 hypothetical protein Bfra_011797 [Botrytis fragariae]